MFSPHSPTALLTGFLSLLTVGSGLAGETDSDQKSEQSLFVATTLVGDGTDAHRSGKIDQARVGGPFGLVIGPDLALYLCETTTHRISRLDPATDTLTTVAGTGEQGYAGDGGPATKAKLNEPYEVRFDVEGNMYFVERLNHTVRRIDAKTKTITTVAGTGKAGFSGDGGPATEAMLHQPHSIALDNQNRLFICDIKNHRIRVVDLKTGVIDTYAGNGKKQPTPDGARAKAAPLSGPRALDYDGGTNLYLALREGNRVYRIDLTGDTLHHIAGTGKKGYSGDGGSAKQAKLAGPKGITVSAANLIYIADTESHTVRMIDPERDLITTVCGTGKSGDGPDGAPLKCQLARPHGVFVDQNGTLYIGDSNNHKVRIVGLRPKE